MTRVLWFSGVLSGSDRRSTGTWLDSLSKLLTKNGGIEVANIAFTGVSAPERQDFGPIKQWLIPSTPISTLSGLPGPRVVAATLRAVEEFRPDLIHVWGVEGFPGLLTARGLLKVASILEMQGVKGELAKVFSGGLTLAERLRCIGLKEVVQLRLMDIERRKFARWGRFEEEIIRGHSHVLTQTSWVDSYVKSVNPDCRTHQSSRAIFSGSDLAEVRKWTYRAPSNPVIFVSAAYSAPFKGLHVAIRALATLKHQFPRVQLRIAGSHIRTGVRQDGYVSWLVREIQRLGVSENVTWLGPLNSSEIQAELVAASAFIVPSFLENCSTSMQEAMAIGTPVVATYTGGLPSLARDEHSALFFPPGDHCMCALQISRVLCDKELAVKLSSESLRLSDERNSPARVLYHLRAAYAAAIRGGA